MGYKALITLDLHDATSSKRDCFNDELEKNGWEKITKLTTTWKYSFEFGATRSSGISKLVNHIRDAKDDCSIWKVDYAIQLGDEDVVSDTLY